MNKLLLALVASALVSACSSGGNSAAVAICKAAVEERMTDQNAKFDPGMAGAAVVNAEGIVVIESSFSGERTENSQVVPYTQTFSCSVQMKDDQGKENPRLIRMQINW